MNNYINIDKISASLIASVYFSAVIFIYTIVNTVSVVMFIMLYSVMFLFILYKLKLSKKISAALVISIIFYTVLLIINLDSHLFFIKLPVIFLFIFNIYYIFSLLKLSIRLRKLYKHNYMYMNKNKFNPLPARLLVLYVVLGIIISYISTIIRVKTGNDMSSYNFISIIDFVVILLLLSYIYLFYILLYKYKSAFVVLSLSSNRKIHVSSLFNKNSTDIYEWFKNQVEPYVYHVHYKEENNVITFDNEDDISDLNEQNEAVEYGLDKSIAVIKSLLADEKSHEIAGILKSIIDKLNKINNMDKEKHQFNKYIHHINERYIPYIKSLVQAYYNNMQLDLDLTKTMQEKIILSLEKINDTFEKSVQEMNNKNMLELESYIQAMDIMLNYKNSDSKA